MKTVRNGKVISGTVGNATEVNYKNTTVAAVLDNMSAADLDKVITEENISSHRFPPEEHNHDDRYYTEEEINTKLDGKADASHTHTKSQITDFPTLGNASSKNFTTSVVQNSGDLITSGAVYTGLAGKANTSHGIHVPTLPTTNPSEYCLKGDNKWYINDIIKNTTSNVAAVHKSGSSLMVRVPTDTGTTCTGQIACGSITANTGITTATITCGQYKTGSFLGLYCGNGAPYIQCLHQDGTNANITANAFVQTSSKDVKENIEPMTTEEAQKLLDLGIVSFTYKEGYGDEGTQYGLIAEEVNEIIPNAACMMPEELKEQGIYNGIDYSKFIPYLIKMVQEQQKEINELKEMVNKK